MLILDEREIDACEVADSYTLDDGGLVTEFVDDKVRVVCIQREGGYLHVMGRVGDREFNFIRAKEGTT